jgi:hypothetical protein
MGCDARARVARCAAIAVLLWAASARAETPVLFAGVLYESPMLVVPAVLAHVTLDSGEQINAAQRGWTTSAEYLRPLNVDLALVAGVELTPLYAHASNLIYLNGWREPSAEFHDTSALASTGVRIDVGRLLHGEARVFVLNEWLSDLDDRALAVAWREPYVGAQWSFDFADLRSDEPFRSRVDGLKARVEAQSFAGADGFVRARGWLSAGRRIGPVFVRGNALAFAVSTDNLVARELIGGSWDALLGAAVYGHPYAEFRVQRGIAANGGVDFELWRGVEIGVRGAALRAPQVEAHGEAVLASAQIMGVLITLGVATPDGDAFRARLDTLLAFATISAATLVP